MIGVGGATIKGIEATLRAKLIVAEGGIVHVYAPSQAQYAAVQAHIEGMTGADIVVRAGTMIASSAE